MATTVADLYTQVLGRAPDAGGLAYWESMFGSSVDPTELATFKSVAQVAEPERVTPPAAAPVVDNTPAVPTTFDPFKSNISPSALQAAPQLDLANLPSTYGAIYSNSYGGDTGADPTPSGFFGPSEVVNGVTVRPYYDAQGNLEKYVGGATQNLSDSVRLSAEWDPTGKAAPVQWNTDNGLFNSGVTFDDAVRTAIIAATAYNALGPTPTGAEAATAGGDAAFVAADASQLAAQGLSQAAIEQNLIAAGVDAFTAFDAAQLALQGIGENQMAGLLTQSAGGNPLFVPSVAGATTSVTPTTNTTTTGTPTGTPTGTGAGTGLSTGTLTPTDLTNLVKAGVGLTGLLGGAAAVGGLTGGGGGLNLSQQDRSGISSGSAQYSPEYYQQIQAKYNQMMPAQPRDVTTELKNWYETKYAPKVA